MQEKIIRYVDLNASIEAAWSAISDFREFGQWFRAEILTPFEVNATVSCRSLYSGHEHLRWEMIILEVVHLKRVTFKWPAYYGDDVERDANNDPWLTASFELSRENELTRLTLTETGFNQLPSEYRSIAKRMNEGGWDEQMKNIKSHVSG